MAIADDMLKHLKAKLAENDNSVIANGAALNHVDQGVESIVMVFAWRAGLDLQTVRRRIIELAAGSFDGHARLLDAPAAPTTRN